MRTIEQIEKLASYHRFANENPGPDDIIISLAFSDTAAETLQSVAKESESTIGRVVERGLFAEALFMAVRKAGGRVLLQEQDGTLSQLALT